MRRLAIAPMRQYRRAMDQELDKILVTTMNDVPGYEIVAVYGEVLASPPGRGRRSFPSVG